MDFSTINNIVKAPADTGKSNGKPYPYINGIKVNKRM